MKIPLSKLTLGVLSLSFLLLQSCTIDNAYRKSYSSISSPTFKPKRVPMRQIKISGTKRADLNWARKIAKKDDLILLGISDFSGGTYNHKKEIREHAWQVGADLVVGSSSYLGSVQGTRMVPTSFTPGRTITSNTNSYGNSTYSGSASAYGSGGYATANYSGTGSYTGYSNTSTYVPPQTTYGAVPHTSQVFRNRAAFFRSKSDLADKKP